MSQMQFFIPFIVKSHPLKIPASVLEKVRSGGSCLKLFLIDSRQGINNRLVGYFIYPEHPRINKDKDNTKIQIKSIYYSISYLEKYKIKCSKIQNLLEQ